ncbi:MAG TPA: site-specific integrase [Bacteroidia bacterium]|nr:site-specific integrase [Bacteroidia bacterium]
MGDMIKVLFYARKSKTNSTGHTPVYLRVTVNGQRFETATARFVEVSKWSQEAGRATGSAKEAKELNEFLDVLRAKAFDIQKKLITIGLEVTTEVFRKHWHGIKEKSRMLLEIFQHHNDQVKELIGRQYSISTHRRYETSLEHTRLFIAEYYKQTDLAVTSLKYQFITDYEFWLKTKRKCNHNSTIKYLTNFKKIVHICIKNGWLERDPFVGFKMTKHEVDRPYLTLEELEKISVKTFISERINQVRDIFLFSCYTGLAYVDTQKLTNAEISTGIDGEKWIFTSRQKTDSPSRIPLLPQAAAILIKYKDHVQCINKNRVLPVLSNQKMNAYLHEISDICGINKKMTFHTARHTFATTITLTNGVPIETVGKMLGHKNLRTTQHYAKILDLKVSQDMSALRTKFTVQPPLKTETGS